MFVLVLAFVDVYIEVVEVSSVKLQWVLWCFVCVGVMGGFVCSFFSAKRLLEEPDVWALRAISPTAN